MQRPRISGVLLSVCFVVVASAAVSVTAASCGGGGGGDGGTGGGPAAATGLASGRTEPSGWPLALLIVVYGSYVAAIVAVFVAGVFLSRTAFARAPSDPHTMRADSVRP